MNNRIYVALGLIMAQPALGAPPTTPADIAIQQENGRFVARTAGDAMPIYTFDRDPLGISSCTDACAKQWPPIMATAHEKPTIGNWAIILRADGLGQWAYKGKPVYRFAGDTPAKPQGDGLGGVWHLLPAIPEE